MTRTIELTIDSIAAGGDGVARSGGLVVFVPRSAPGDAGRVRIEKAGRFARARWDTIERPGPARVVPPCPHYTMDRCGGCQLQHMAYPAQLDAKSDIIRDALQRIGKRAAPRPTVRPSPNEWRYRRKLTLALRRRSLDDRWIAGLHPYDAPGRVFDLADCPITDERVIAIWRDIRAAAALLPVELELRGAVRLVADEGASTASFLLEGGSRWPNHREFFDAVPALASLWWQPDNQGRRQLASRGRASDTSFVQVNAAVAARLHEHVVELALAHHPATLIDAYAGSGGTAAPLAAAGVRVTAIELDPEGAARGAARLGPPSRMIQARVENVLSDLLPADIVLLNPPRHGLDEQVPAILLRSAVRPVLIYTSCNPATLARDVGRLPGYRIASITAFDMFPQTAHVETVCELVPESE